MGKPANPASLFSQKLDRVAFVAYLLGAVVPDLRRHGIGRQLQEAQQAWAKDHGYEYIRCECMNHQREFIHFAVTLGYDIIGIRWDSTHADNLIVFEKNLIE